MKPERSGRFRLQLLLGAVLAALPLIATAFSPAFAATGQITGYGGKCVDVAAANSTNGTQVQLYTCNGTNAQSWTVGTDGTIRALGKCLDVSGANSANGTKVQIWDCNGTNAQVWTAYGDHTLRALGKCLDATGPSSADGTPLQIWDCYASANQQWNLPSGSTPPPPAKLPGAPYLTMGWGNPPNPTTVMSATGVKSFTMAFILAANGGCNPQWDGNRPLTGGADAQAISAIKGAGGSVEISFGGWSGNKLGTYCTSSSAYAGAVQQVINALGPVAVDFDIENTDELENATVQDRILGGLQIVKQNNPNVKVVLTIPTSTTGPAYWGTRLINQSKALGVNIDNYTIMPFDFGCSSSTGMYQCTVNASEGLKNALKSAWGWTDAQAYAHMGISGMNGLSDQQELTDLNTWTQIRNYANGNGLTRLAFWSVNRDHGCPGGGVQSTCSGIAQNDWDFTRITAGF